MDTKELQQYYDDLIRHDWYYDYSDDGRVWRAGRDEHDRLRGLSSKSREHRDLYDQVRSWVFHPRVDGDYAAHLADKPKRPE